jgi:hypothetical protein
VIILLADVNIQGHIEIMVKRMQAEPWLGFWNHLELSCMSFADVGLNPGDSDAVIWHRCQERRACLLTNNRNDDVRIRWKPRFAASKRSIGERTTH